MSFYESMIGVKISKACALAALVSHGVEAQTDDFLAVCGDKELYQATDVLDYLGY